MRRAKRVGLLEMVRGSMAIARMPSRQKDQNVSLLLAAVRCASGRSRGWFWTEEGQSFAGSRIDPTHPSDRDWLSFRPMHSPKELKAALSGSSRAVPVGTR